MLTRLTRIPATRLATQRSYATQANVRKGRKKGSPVKVILTQDLPWGQKGEEIVVAKGFARNYLFASSKAVHATTATRKEYSEFAKKIDIEARTRAKEAARAKQRLAKLTVKMFRVETAPGVMHAPVSRENICAKMYLQHRVELQPSQLDLPSPLATFGIHQINVDVGENQVVPITVSLAAQ